GRHPVVGELGERLAGEEHAVGVFRLDRAAEHPVLEYERREFARVELIEPCFLVRLAECREQHRLREIDRRAGSAAASAEAARAAGRAVLVRLELLITEPDLALRADVVREIARRAGSI